MNRNSAGYIGFALCLAIGCSTFGVTTGWAAKPSNADSGQVLTIFNCDGRYIKLGAVSGAKVADGFYGSYVARQYKFDGCLISNVLGEGNNVLFALMPQSLNEDENGTQDFIVASLDSKTLKTLHSYSSPTKDSGIVSLLYDSARHNLLALFDNWHSVQRLAIEPNGELIPADPPITLEQPLAGLVSPYVDGQSNMIAGDLVLNPKGRVIRKVNADSVLDSALKTKFSSLTQIKGSTNHYAGAMVEASAGNRVVFTVGWDTEGSPAPKAGVMVYDLRAGHVITSFFSTFPVLAAYDPGPSLHLTPDGKTIVIEQYSWGPSYQSPGKGEELRQSPFRTGVIAIYDANSGLLTGKVSMKAPPRGHAAGHIVNFSNDSHYLYYWFDQHLYVIDLEGTSVVSELTLPDQFDPVAVVSKQ